MALARGRRGDRRIDYWPGFVDALSTLLLAIMFLLSVFVLAQFLLSREISGKDEVLTRLNSQINELTQLLALEKSSSQDAEDALANLQASLSAAESEKSRLEQLLSQGAGAEANARIGTLSGELESERQVSQRALSQVELLNQQISALRRQIGALEEALNASEARDKESNTKIADLGRRLNVALAQRVQELNRYRSDFFGRLREILSDRENIRIVGDRFVFQSEVLFPTGSEQINEAGRGEMKKLADAIIELQKEIPPEINWVQMCIRDSANALMQAAAEAGNRFAQFNYAQMLVQREPGGKGLEKAVPYYERAAATGLPDAQYAMAQVYANGVGGKRRDDNQARLLLVRAARQNYDSAQFDLGLWMADGRGGDRDLKSAFGWMKLAADGGNVAAQNRIAKFYMGGIGVDPDPILAGAWYISARRAGLNDPEMDDFLRGLTDAEMKQALERANRLR